MSATQEKETWVFWDIGSCPVPDGNAARMVRSSIESMLNQKGYNGPYIITALGNLMDTLKRTPEVLKALSDTGILLNNVPFGISHLMDEVINWTWVHPAPPTLLLITGDVFGETFSRSVSMLRHRGYTILLAHPSRLSGSASSIESTFEGAFSWDISSSSVPVGDDDLLVGSSIDYTELFEGSVFCALCEFTGYSFEDLTTHLKTADHALTELDTVERPVSKKLERKLKNFNESHPNDATTMESFKETEEWDRFTV